MWMDGLTEKLLLLCERDYIKKRSLLFGRRTVQEDKGTFQTFNSISPATYQQDRNSSLILVSAINVPKTHSKGESTLRSLKLHKAWWFYFRRITDIYLER